VAVAVAAAVLDWVAVANESPVLERCAKPVVLVALLAAAVTARPAHAGVHGWLVLALCCGLIGDIALSFAPAGAVPAGAVPAGAVPAEPAGGQPPSGLFVVGLASFLLGHLCYSVALLSYGVGRLSLGFGLVLILLVLCIFGRRILAGAYQQDGNKLMIPVAVYIAALGSAVVLGVGTSSLWLGGGIVAFAFSDLVLATDRFVIRRSWAPLTVAMSYHLAQLLLLVGLVR
jgi:uncharacterized membrane protein YhhN